MNILFFCNFQTIHIKLRWQRLDIGQILYVIANKYDKFKLIINSSPPPPPSYKTPWLRRMKVEFTVKSKYYYMKDRNQLINKAKFS